MIPHRPHTMYFRITCGTLFMNEAVFVERQFFFKGILTAFDFWHLNSAMFAGFEIHGPVWRAEDQDNSYTQQLLYKKHCT